MDNETPTAFPWTHNDMTCTGMTLRDYFAAKAMQSILPQYDVCASGDDEGYATNPDGLPFLLAKDAYAVADAMMEARKS
jgi:hypothetical protein